MKPLLLMLPLTAFADPDTHSCRYWLNRLGEVEQIEYELRDLRNQNLNKHGELTIRLSLLKELERVRNETEKDIERANAKTKRREE